MSKHNSATEQARRLRIKERLDVMKVQVGCTDCGYNAHPAALDFDHIPGSGTKRFNISQARSHSWQEIEAEIAKCEVVCSNCHRIRTTRRRYEASDWEVLTA